MIKNRIIILMLFFCVVINAPVSAKAINMPSAPIVTTEAVVLIDGDTGQVLYDKNMSRRMYPASITKIMTALLALENGNLRDNITMSHDAVFSVGRNTSHIALDVDEVISLEQALYALAMQSANDAANGIAELIGGSMTDFVRMMNSRAAHAGALDTNFINAHGLHDDNHYTTAHDMARIMMDAIEYPDFIRFFSAGYYEMSPTNKQSEPRYFWRTGSLITGANKYDGVIAEKTGWTSISGNTYVVAAKKNGRTLIAVLLNAPNPASRREDVVSLLDYGFNNLKAVTIKADDLTRLNYSMDGMSIDLLAVNDFHCLIDNSLSESDIDIEYIVSYDDNNVICAKAVFTLKSKLHENMYQQMGEAELLCISDDNTPVISYPSQADTPLIDEDMSEDENDSKRNPVFTIAMIVVCIFVAAVLSLYIMNTVFRTRRRRRRRR